MFNKENISKIDFTSSIGNIYFQRVALFNKNKISFEEATKMIQLDGMSENPSVIIISKEQFENVFDSK